MGTGALSRAQRRDMNEALGAQTQSERLDMPDKLPVRVKRIDPATQTVELEVLYKPVFDGEARQIPDVHDVPVSMARGGGFYTGTPLKVGDEGLLNIAARDLDGFRDTGEASGSQMSRLNALADGIFEPGGIASRAKALANFDPENAFWGTEDGKNGVRISPGGNVAVEAAGFELLERVVAVLEKLEGEPNLVNTDLYGEVRGNVDAMRLKR